MATKLDVRIIKTKERLKNALLTLLHRKRLDQITISEICSLATINRNTFYSHYQSVKDLLDEIEAQFLESLLYEVNISSDTTKSVTEILELILSCAKENKEMCMLLLSENGDKSFLKNILMFCLPSAVQNWSDSLKLDSDDATTLYFFIVGGAVNVIEQWILADFDKPVEELAAKLNSIILFGQSAFEK